MSNHTPTPWHLSRDSRGIALAEGTEEANNGTALFIASDWGHRNKKGQSAFDEEKAKDNFDFMLLACNSHYDLLWALKAVDDAPSKLNARLRYIVKAAIAKAEGQQ